MNLMPALRNILILNMELLGIPHLNLSSSNIILLLNSFMNIYYIESLKMIH